MKIVPRVYVLLITKPMTLPSAVAHFQDVFNAIDKNFGTLTLLPEERP